MKTKEGHEKRINKFNDYQKKTTESFYSYQKNITTVSLGFLALFISLKPKNIEFIHAKYFFFSTVLLFGLCILFSLITQHGELVLYRKSAVARAKILLEYIDSHDGKTYQSEFVKLGKVYLISEKLTYICLFFSIISLISYSYFLILG